MKKIVYTRPGGGVSIVCPAPKEAIEKVLGELTEQQYVEHVIARSVPEDASNVRYVEEEDIPSDREFRNAWCDKSDKPCIDIDSVKAIDVAISAIREQRTPLLAKADLEFMKALENGEDTSAIVARKNELREATEPLKELKASVDELATPELLEQLKQMAVIE